MELKIDITPLDLNTLQEILKEQLPQITVWAFGSRVKFTSRPNSDLDLVAFTSKEEAIKLLSLAEAIESALLPFRVDLHSWHEIPENFKKNIESNFVVIQSKE